MRAIDGAGRRRFHRWYGCAAIAALVYAGPSFAQERLIGNRTVGVGMSMETISFGGAGLLQSAFAGLDTTRVTRVTQFSLPITASSPLGGSWRLDVTSFYAAGRITYGDSISGTTRTATLAGVSDVRARATGQLFRDAVLLTFGVNAPTGPTSLDAAQFSALRVVSAPALGMGSPPVGAGLSGTVGVVFAQQTQHWALAYGTSYEMRGQFQPVAALTAGTGATDFLPGGVFRASLGADRLVGNHRLSIAAAADIFADDRLRGAVLGDSAPAGVTGESRVRLGPVLSGDLQLLIAAPRVRELLTYASYRWRAPYARDGQTVERSSGQYIETGVRTVVPWRRGRDVVLAADGRWHSGLGVDQGLPTAGVTSGSVMAALQITRGLMTTQPYVRAQAGTLRQRASQLSTGSQRFVGVGGGLVLVTRF